MNRKLSYMQIVLILTYLFIGVILIIKWPNTFTINMKENYLMLVIAYFCVMGVFLGVLILYKIEFFEPFIIISTLYIGIFILKPIVDFLNLNIYSHGKDISDGCIKATIIFIISYICFCIGYLYKRKKKSFSALRIKFDEKKILKLSVIIWGISFIFCLIHLKSIGVNLQYIFSLGSKGDMYVENTSSALLFLSNFALTLITSWMYILVYSKKLPIKIITSLIMLIYLIMRGGRWLLLIFIVAPIVYYYSIERKKPAKALLIILGVSLLLVFAFIQETRYGIKNGHGIVFEGFTLEMILSPFESDLGTYKIFYGLVSAMPREMGYKLGSGMFLYTIIMFIPRALWPNKPVSPMHEVIEVAVNTSARISGSALPNIGECYYEFGVLGCILLMFIFGFIVSRLLILKNSFDKQKIIIYSVLLPLLFQWTARGSFPHNFYSTVFLLLPYFGIKIFSKKFII